MWGKGGAISWDDIKRLEHSFDQVLSVLRDMETRLNSLEMEWAETRDQVRRSYQRVEASERRAAARGALDPESPSERPADEQLDPFSRKIRQIREGTTDAVQSGDAESPG